METIYYSVYSQIKEIPHTDRGCTELAPTTAITLHKAYADDVIGQLYEDAEQNIRVCRGDSLMYQNGANYYCNENTNLEWRRVRKKH